MLLLTPALIVQWAAAKGTATCTVWLRGFFSFLLGPLKRAFILPRFLYHASTNFAPKADIPSLTSHPERRLMKAASLVRILPGLEAATSTARGPVARDEDEGIPAFTSLDSSKTEIRLARIEVELPPVGDDTNDTNQGLIPVLHLKMHTASLDDPELQYFALCHVYSGEANATSILKLGGRPMSVSSALVEALGIVHDSFGGNNGPSDFYIWASEACVNHDDASERASQVALGRRIYQRAAKVLLYLGPAGGTQARCLFAFIRVWSRTLVEWKEWTGSSRPDMLLLAKLDDVMRTAWETWDEALVVVVDVQVGGGEGSDQVESGTSKRNTQPIESQGNRELAPVSALRHVFQQLPYWSCAQAYQESCGLDDVLLLCQRDVVVGLNEVSRVFLWIKNFAEDVVGAGRPECISSHVWDALECLVVEIPKTPIYPLLIDVAEGMEP